MLTINLFEKYNLQIIQTEETADKIYKDLAAMLKKDSIQIDMQNMLYITTNCMRRIIGQIYRDCSSEEVFYDRVKTINVNRKISSVIDLVIEEERKH
jgi:hypothetical protein